MIAYKNPYPTQTLGAGETVAYVVPDGVVASVRALTLHNTRSDVLVVQVLIVPPNLSSDVAHQLVKKSLGENQSYLCPELANHVLTSGTKVVLTGQGVNAMLSVAEQAL